jgi:D-cysteine desulfhydrase/L-cysteate sulfo-lyase
VRALARATARRCGATVREAEVILDERFIGEGYAIPSPEAREAQRLFARLDGIVLDTVYTAKAAAGLIALARESPRGTAFVFLHTGGTPEVFAERLT